MNTDAEHLPELTKRQEEILSLIVRAYTENPEPVSSKYLTDLHELGISSATVRNEMSVLEDLGYIKAPHKSAGRVPSEEGYRYFVKRLINKTSLSTNEENYIKERFQALPVALEQWMRFAATVLARTSQTASLVTPPRAEISRFKHVELVAIQGRLVLMVLVLHGGMVHQRMLNLADPIPQDKLTEAATHININLMDLYPQQIRLKGMQMPLLEREVIDLILDLMERADNQPARIIYRDGLSDIIGSFQDGEGAQQAVRVYEERAYLDTLLAQMPDETVDTVRVIVAGDGHYNELSRLSMVLSRYGIPGQISGAIGVLGPTHINYGRAISSVRYVSGIMTSRLIDLYHVDPDDSEDTDEKDLDPADQ